MRVWLYFVLAAEMFLTGWNGTKKSKMEWNGKCTQLHVTGTAQPWSSYLWLLFHHRGFMNKSALSNCFYVSKHGTEASSSSGNSYGSYEKPELWNVVEDSLFPLCQSPLCQH